MHFLDGEPVRQGETLELLLAGGQWLRGTYEWSGQLARWAGFRVPLGGPTETAPRDGFVPAAVLALHPDAVLRRLTHL